LGESGSRISDLESQVAEAQQQVDSKAAELGEVQAKTTDLQEQIGALQERLSSAEQSASEQTAVAENLASRIALLQQGDEKDQANAADMRDRIEASLLQAGVVDTKVSLRDDNGIVVNLRSEALFNSGRARLSPAGRKLMGKVANALENLDNAVVVEGHTDSIPVTGSLLAIFPSNWELSVARAANTINYLQNKGGLDPDRLSALGYGQYRPIAPNNTRAGRAENRRVEIVVQP
jgi:flagellar motor protein MotB